MPENIPFHRADITDNEIHRVTQVLKSKWLTTGPVTLEFENKLAEYLNSKHVVALSSCTAALALGLRVLDIKPGDEVITTPYTYVATIAEIIHVGAIPVFIDSDYQTGNMDPNLIERAITDKTKLILPVHFAGHPCNMDAIMNIAEKYNLRVMEDAAHAFESSWNGHKIGSISDVTCFSFYATKNITCGEGGAISTNDSSIADKVRLLSRHGINRQTWQRDENEEYLYKIDELGYKANMPDILSAIGLAQFDKINDMYQKRKQIWDWYHDALSSIPEVTLPVVKANQTHAYHLYVILLHNAIAKKRTKVRKIMNERGVETSIHFHSLHLFNAFKNRKESLRFPLPNCEKWSNNNLSLPIYPMMNYEHVIQVVNSLKDAIIKVNNEK